MTMANPYTVYRQHNSSQATRIDLILAAYNEAVAQLEHACDILRYDVPSRAAPQLLRAQQLVYALAVSVDLQQGDVGKNLLRLYDFVLYRLGLGDLLSVESTVRVLRTLREGFLAIRPDALKMEHLGVIPPLPPATALRLMDKQV